MSGRRLSVRHPTENLYKIPPSPGFCVQHIFRDHIKRSSEEWSYISLAKSFSYPWNFWTRLSLTDTGENVQKWTRVFSTRRWVILVARTRRENREENSASTFGRFRRWTSLESSPVSVKTLGCNLKGLTNLVRHR